MKNTPKSGSPTSSPSFYWQTLFIITFSLLIMNCPDPPEETICGQGMELVNDACECIPNSHPSDDDRFCECDTLYHWDGDLDECVMDTTSHNFTWTIDTFGTYYTILRDVEIVDENNIWVVGTIRDSIPDSSGAITIKETYNAAHWNGSEWILFSIYHGALELDDIIYFEEDDIWVCGGSPLHWNGSVWTLYHLWNLGVLNEDEGGVYHAWGTSSNNMYFVGSYGSIVHYDGTEFTKIESGTDINLYSVSGTPDGEYVFVCGRNSTSDSIILQIHNQEIKTIYTGNSFNTLPAGAPRVTYVYGDTAYFASAISVFKYNYLTDESDVVYDSNHYESISAKGLYVKSPNDLFMCGSRSEFIHYNGSSWSSDFSVWGQFGYQGVGTYGLDVKDDTVVIVGKCFGALRGLIAIGKR